ncbi:indolepyruvate ferredoxin oxidoreductase family protein [Aquisalimonas lutea]|uniref:indolepyruvate ferredoxin oxidoreductase family protein n=1 Tax=Aquisalimonas lutea TaxID=1327750 RepID=UPI0025B420B0|nr:indolepyruvate ferredoxin oxidoreductase family protein [Aquisalimonas lutea]MDN3518734.1 indolepyruvate ferredoxin oxidoreductase family protein [Aquisalimonas lutea]
MALADVHLEDKYALETGRIYLNGIQALVRLPLMQARRDARAGHHTAGFISGYRGSPLGGLDKALWDAQAFLEPQAIRFQPGVNEDLAATSVWGSQQVGLWPGARYDGVFGMWYGKAPGVDRSGDVFRHANAAGTAPLGGVLAVAGDDHGCKSSTLPSQSEFAFMDLQMPVLHPADVQDLLDMGLYGWAMSRYSGCWVGLIVVADTADASASVHVDPGRPVIQLPDDFRMPPDGLGIRWPDRPLEQEARLHRYKLNAVRAFARVNGIDRITLDSPRPRLGIVTTGKAYLDLCQALEDLGIDAAAAAAIGLRVYKVGMPWPLEPEGAARFAEGLDEILVVEEKRPLIEPQLREQLYNHTQAARPRIVGKYDEQGEWLLPSEGELHSGQVARVIAARIRPYHTTEVMERRLRFLDEQDAALAASRPLVERLPHFCSGCPHNTSTRVPEGSRATAGIGCHYMAHWMDRSTETFTHMGGEGVPWIGQAPFTETQHIFANIGDGTYYHSGLLAVRAAVAGGVNITYKILYNDAVAMTGGQHVDGPLSVPQVTRQLAAEGVQRIVVVSDEPEKYTGATDLAPGTSVHDRRELDGVQRELREIGGVSALIYDQTCAAEKRRQRKRGTMPDPAKRAFINSRVCEGCGDCNAKSNCLSVVPLETELGRKRAIDQGQCNKDFSCVDGFCPSFVTVHGADLRRPEGAADTSVLPPLDEPAKPALDRPYGMVITGVGGTGVVTVAALLGMAAHLDGRGVAVLDMTGLAQKYGAVTSHVRVGTSPEAVHGPKIPAGEADLLLGCDLVVASGQDSIARLSPERSAAVVNTHGVMPAEFIRNPDMAFPQAEMLQRIRDNARDGACLALDAAALTEGLFGDSTAMNLFLLGAAYQQGLVPVSAEAIDQAIALNGTAVEANRQAFFWGRHAARNPERVETLVRGDDTAEEGTPTDLAAWIERRRADLVAYQDEAYADRYMRLLERVRAAEQRAAPESEELVRAVAFSYFRLLAAKDEYEVARLYTDGAFARELERTFTAGYRLRIHLAPPLLARRDPHTGEPRKHAFGPWILPALRLLARMKGLRGRWMDPFAYSADRRLERTLLREFEALCEELVDGLRGDNHEAAVALARLYGDIRGFGHVKEASAGQARERRDQWLKRFRQRQAVPQRPAPEPA